MAKPPLSQPVHTRTNSNTKQPPATPPMHPPSQLDWGSSDEFDGGEFDGGVNDNGATMVGTSSIVSPSAAEAASAVPRVEASEVCTSSAAIEAGTAMVAVMRTLAAATRIVTSDLSTPAASATFCCKLALLLSE